MHDHGKHAGPIESLPASCPLYPSGGFVQYAHKLNELFVLRGRIDFAERLSCHKSKPPVDISEADKYSSLSTYYFGHHPANRFEFSRGRDLVFTPGPDEGPINFLAYPVLEIAGKQVKINPEFFFERQASKGTR